MKIRQVNKEDYQEIDKLVKTAFETAKVSDGDEQAFVKKLRDSKKYIPKLELVAFEEQEIIGHIMLTKTNFTLANGQKQETLLLAPLCVKLEYRNKKVGEKLVNEAFKRAIKLGYTSAFLVGYPKYYKRFGFKETSTFNIQNKTGIPNEFVLACEIVKGSLDKMLGSITELE